MSADGKPKGRPARRRRVVGAEWMMLWKTEDHQVDKTLTQRQVRIRKEKSSASPELSVSRNTVPCSQPGR